MSTRINYMTILRKKALNDSIKVWEKRVKGVVVCGECPLCLVQRTEVSEGCKDCPIHEVTKHACSETPYYKWAELEDYDSPEAMKSAQDELDFLLEVKEKTYGHKD